MNHWYNPANNINPNADNNMFTMIDNRYKEIREMGCKTLPIYVGDTDDNETAYEAVKCYEGRGYVGVRVMEHIKGMPLYLFVTEDIELFISASQLDRDKVLWYECANHRFVRQCVFNDLISNHGYNRYISKVYSNRFLIDAYLQTRDLCDIGMIIEHTIDALNCQTPHARSHTVLS